MNVSLFPIRVDSVSLNGNRLTVLYAEAGSDLKSRVPTGFTIHLPADRSKVEVSTVYNSKDCLELGLFYKGKRFATISLFILPDRKNEDVVTHLYQRLFELVQAYSKATPEEVEKMVMALSPSEKKRLLEKLKREVGGEDE